MTQTSSSAPRNRTLCGQGNYVLSDSLGATAAVGPAAAAPLDHDCSSQSLELVAEFAISPTRAPNRYSPVMRSDPGPTLTLSLTGRYQSRFKASGDLVRPAGLLRSSKSGRISCV